MFASHSSTATNLSQVGEIVLILRHLSDMVEFSFSEGPLEMDDCCIETSFSVSPNLSGDAILGMDVLNSFHSLQCNLRSQDLTLC